MAPQLPTPLAVLRLPLFRHIRPPTPNSQSTYARRPPARAPPPTFAALGSPSSPNPQRSTALPTTQARRILPRHALPSRGTVGAERSLGADRTTANRDPGNSFPGGRSPDSARITTPIAAGMARARTNPPSSTLPGTPLTLSQEGGGQSARTPERREERRGEGEERRRRGEERRRREEERSQKREEPGPRRGESPAHTHTRPPSGLPTVQHTPTAITHRSTTSGPALPTKAWCTRPPHAREGRTTQLLIIPAAHTT